MEWKLYSILGLFLKVPLGRGAWESWCNHQSAYKLCQIFPLGYLGNDNISAFTCWIQAWKREGEESESESQASGDSPTNNSDVKATLD